MATILQPPLSAGANRFSSSPSFSSSYPDLVALKGGLPHEEDLDSKHHFIHAEYDRPCAPSIPSTAPSSPLYTQSRDSYFSTPSYSSLDSEEDFMYEDDDGFPSFENNTPRSHQGESHLSRTTEDTSSESTTTADTPSGSKQKSIHAKDDLSIEHEPTRHVDYLSHNWREQDIWSSWRYVNSRRPKLTNTDRLENASWRTWTKAKYSLKTISPESLNWMKDCDVTWLYGPLHVEDQKSLIGHQSPPTSQLSRCSSFLNKKPILKKKSPSAILLEKSLQDHTLLQRAGDIIKVQRSSPVPSGGGLRKGGSDFSLPSYRTSSVLNTPAEMGDCSFGTHTPTEAKHVFFNEEVRQVQAIDSEDDEKGNDFEEDEPESDEDDDCGLMMAPPGMRSNRSTPRSSFSSDSKTIAPLPSTTLKYRKETPEPQQIPTGNLWTPGRDLRHSSSQDTLKPSKPSHNFLLDDDPELNDEPWGAQSQPHGYSPYADEDQDEPTGMRRTPSGMFMPYDENEEEAAMNNSLFGQAVYAVNTFRDIAHVVWNVGWNRAR